MELFGNRFRRSPSPRHILERARRSSRDANARFVEQRALSQEGTIQRSRIGRGVSVQPCAGEYFVLYPRSASRGRAREDHAWRRAADRARQWSSAVVERIYFPRMDTTVSMGFIGTSITSLETAIAPSTWIRAGPIGAPSGTFSMSNAMTPF